MRLHVRVAVGGRREVCVSRFCNGACIVW